MSGVFPSKDTVTRLRTLYTPGSRVELVSMDDPHTSLKPGDRGTVEFVDDIGSVFIWWDNGFGLAAAYGTDVIRRI